LYEVASKAAYRDADKLPPWPPLVLLPSGRTYHFPFRLNLKQVRTLEEPLVRSEFAYVAENLLLRGGYRKTHFQADQTTLQNVSEMGTASSTAPEPVPMPGTTTYVPSIVRGRSGADQPYVFPLRELIVQTLLRRYLSTPANLNGMLVAAGVEALDTDKLEVLGEKAFPEGHVDILIKEATPMRLYMERLREECAGGVLVASTFGKRILKRAAEQGIACSRYSLEGIGETPLDCNSLLSRFQVTAVSA
jgi:hypothetical protein